MIQKWFLFSIHCIHLMQSNPLYPSGWWYAPFKYVMRWIVGLSKSNLCRYNSTLCQNCVIVVQVDEYGLKSQTVYPSIKFFWLDHPACLTGTSRFYPSKKWGNIETIHSSTPKVWFARRDSLKKRWTSWRLEPETADLEDAESAAFPKYFLLDCDFFRQMFGSPARSATASLYF